MWAIALLLAVAVSSWGLHYKLSLYYPSAVRTQGPHAKLLSQRERPAVSFQLEAFAATGEPLAEVRLPAVAHALAALASIAMQPEPKFLTYLELDHDSGSRHLHCHPLDTPRPPPVTA